MDSTVTQQVMIATKEDISRLEVSIKELTEVVKNVILLGERQTVQGQRIGDLETENGILRTKLETINTELNKRVDEVNAELKSWVNRGVGAWAVVGIVFIAVKFIVGH